MAALDVRLENPEATEVFGRRLASCQQAGLLVYLYGDLGAGKTTLVRGYLRGLGHQGRVKSPTYTLIEPYQTEHGRVYHLDLYRLSDPDELEWIGLRDLFDGESVCLIEWPQRGEGVLPEPDVDIRLSAEGQGRRLMLEALSPRGEQVARCLGSL
ncbi:tRNA threonylcarbamoyladenosine biosynthesis protein TsaE [Thiogranum longum]|uniref:tRNA threonylcarbamoyladenosine biosynthesis protein TsaE n=1 Tax=Thiogranum longum TaxID=1537524 RepID=A0A4R1HC96_9GAMM|nr:tRNA (adenosine(37)-N6)-threonylcarbamoyltransferase complex ATPase subunit type 1 TsaE [Thiogranum longum]TCK19058.1 tRNA threonylcarbamoyladenosine biosynthesis protein TsaE [Thiogranum longum]